VARKQPTLVRDECQPPAVPEFDRGLLHRHPPFGGDIIAAWRSDDTATGVMRSNSSNVPRGTEESLAVRHTSWRRRGLPHCALSLRRDERESPMLRWNMRLIFCGLAAVAVGLAGGWTLFAVLPGKTSTPTTQTTMVTRAVAPKVSEPVPSVAAPAAEPEPAAPAARPEPAPIPVPTAEPAPSASTAPSTAPAAGERTKEVTRVRGKQRVMRRDDDDDDEDD
jgi:hypothetical protein